MTTSRTSFLTEIIDGKTPIPERKLAYFRERQRNRLYDFIVSKFLEREKSDFTKADLARRLQKRPEQITRWLSTPGNWTLDTISDLTLAIYGEELEFAIRPFEERSERNSTQIALLSHQEKNYTYKPEIFPSNKKKEVMGETQDAQYQCNPQKNVYGLGSKQESTIGASV